MNLEQNKLIRALNYHLICTEQIKSESLSPLLLVLAL